MLSRHQSNPRRHLPPVGEAPCVSDRRYQCAGAQGSDTGDLLKLLAQLAAAMPSLDLRFELADLAIELLEVVQQSLHQMPDAAGSLSVAFSRTSGTRFLTFVMPFGITRPNSLSRLRIWLACAVRALTKL